MENLAPVPLINVEYSFFPDGIIKKENEYKARVVEIYSIKNCDRKLIYKYDTLYEDVVATPLLDIWIEAVEDLFWILSDETDFIIELIIPKLCQTNVYVARTVDGGWHAFEIVSSKEFGLLDVTGELSASINN